MKEFADLLDVYSRDGYHMYSNTISRSEWGDKEVAESYLKKYWLQSVEYEQKWKPIQDQIFINQDSGLPKRVFAADFELLVGRGGCLFVKEEFAQLQACILEIGAKYLLIVENTFGARLKDPAFRMKYPANISWEHLNGGNFISSIMIEMPHKEYFVFGDIPNWGKYSANDYEVPLDVIGYKAELREIFREKFKLLEANRAAIAEHVPLEYRVDDKRAEAR